MTIKQKSVKVYDEHDPLRPSHITSSPTKVKIVTAPRIIKTKFTDDQPVMEVKHGVETLTWWANWTSLNELIRKFGEDETKMVGKDIDLVLVKQPIEGKMKKVIYLEGSFKEEEDD